MSRIDDNATVYDYLIVGSGLYGSVCARELTDMGYKVLVCEKRNHIGGNVYTENVDGINVHKYGAHIFHTNNKQVWDYVNKFAEFNRYTNSPLANFHGEVFNLPFNMNTFNKLWGVTTPQEAKDKIAQTTKDLKSIDIKNLEDQAISQVGEEIYNKFIKGYTEKQWGRKATSLPSFIIKRIPVRFTYDNNYFMDRYQGIPIGGYTKIMEKLLEGIEVHCGLDYFESKSTLDRVARKIIYTGPIDRFFDYKFGKLEYRSLKFESSKINVEDFQGNAVINYTDSETAYTRIIEHKHFEMMDTTSTIITKEYPVEFNGANEPYYPINNEVNSEMYKLYRKEASKLANVFFGGRLAEYKYYDMHQVIAAALYFCEKIRADAK